ncbi:MAG: hypothetical protein JW855_01815 [Gammaproteobacteria bacterium]|nr:hypothetical protein [Gammaproteobacteria bacterium]
MSLINKVLKDVEKKHRKTVEDKNTEEDVLTGLSSPKKVRRQRSWNVAVLLLVLIILLALLIYSYWPLNIEKIEKSVIQEIPTQSIFQMNRAVPAAPLPQKEQEEIDHEKMLLIKPTIETLNDVAITTQEQLNVINLQLSHPTHYYVDHQNQTLKITLMNTQLLKPLTLDTTHTFLRAIHFQQSQQDTMVVLDLIPNTQIQALQLQNSNLQILLHNASPVLESMMAKKSVPLSPQQLAEQQYFNAISLLQERKKDLAIIALGDALQKYPEVKAPRELLAALLIERRQLWQAKQIIWEGLKQYPDYLPFITLQSRILMQEGNISGAISVLKQKAPSIQRNPNFYVLMASLYRQNGQYLEAARIYNNLTKMDSTVGIWWLGLGISLEALDQTNAAREAYSHALSCEDLSPQIRAYITQKLST